MCSCDFYFFDETFRPANAESSVSEAAPRTKQGSAAVGLGPTAGAGRCLQLPLHCATQQQQEGSDPGGAVEGVEDVRRVYDTWRWRDYKINFRVEGVVGEGTLSLSGRWH